VDRLERFVGSRAPELRAHEVAQPLDQLEKDDRVLVQSRLL
jgi:hypothetical protein